LKRIVLAVVALLSTVRASNQATPDAIVAAAYPATLSEIAAQRHYADLRQQAYAVLADGGKKLFVAAYSNGHVGAVELLQQTPAGAVTVSQLIRDHQQGANPTVTARDLDGDGIPELIASFDLGPRGGAEAWIYRVRDGQLTLLSPVDRHGDTVLGLPDVVEFAGGVSDLVDRSNVGDSRSEPVLVFHHYVFRNGAFVEAEPLDFYATFYRAKAAPRAEDATFAIPSSALSRPYRLVVLNGATSGKDYRVASGTVSLNGVVVAPASDFSESRPAWTLPVALQAQNTLTVKLAGRPKGRIAIAIRHD
jgi:hypothetical protein